MLVIVVFMSAISLMVLAATLSRTNTTSSLNDRSGAHLAALSAAEAATEKVVATMIRDFRNGGHALVTANLNSYRTNIPSAGDAGTGNFWTNYVFSDAIGNNQRTYVNVISNFSYVQLESQYAGLYGYAIGYRALSNARPSHGRNTAVVNAVQQDLQLATIPVFQFAIFYNGLLEFTWAAPFTVRGRTHSNSSIYTGSSQPLNFLDYVTAAGVIQKRAWAGYNLNNMTGSIDYQAGSSTNVPSLTLPIGTNNTSSAVREILNMPPVGEDPNSPMGKERYANKANLLLVVTNNSVTAFVRSNSTSILSLPWTNTATTLGLSNFVSTNVVFYDHREDKTIRTTQLDIGRFNLWLRTNYAAVRALTNSGITMYVTDNRSSSSTILPAIRLTNGTALPVKGLTIATPNPLYVLGNYNVPNAAHLNTTNTAQTAPASLASDALTILSSYWSDQKSTNGTSLSNRAATNTTLNAAILTGIVPSAGSNGTSPHSGGVMNVTRLLEDWGNGTSTKLTLNTSLVNLFDSARATSPFQNPGIYYRAPVRDFNFDNNFKDPNKLPPGTPQLGTLIRGRWYNPPAGATNYAGL